MKDPIFIIFFLLIITISHGQEATIKEEIVEIETYGFGKPNPVPMLSDNPKIFPYFKFDAYEHVSKKKDWKVVTLENDYIKVLVLPEIGGKVWGAIEKSTGNEFIYKNEVVKFRNIALRGPWASGGIEMNFGIIGHHPSTATPVDYTTKTNADGSVSCFVSNTDLPSNTRWVVEIRLEKDRAYFETNVSWYNASPISESYYNWMTAAAVVSKDLEFFIPGTTYLDHDGTAHSWPRDSKGRNLAFYEKNNFGKDKSYHVVGEYNDFFGGYYHDRDFGFGQWASYEEMPGQKLWLWSLARSGGIWEDLLTDSDGQYVEFQAGRLLDQYSPGAVNPISQVGFDPFVMDTWSEIWFPLKDIGGMVDASKHGALNVEVEKETVYVGLNAFQKLDKEIIVMVNGKSVFTQTLDLKPMEIFSKTIPVSIMDKIEVVVKGTELQYTNQSEQNRLKRPFYPDLNLKVSKTEQLFQDGVEAMEFREYPKATELFKELLQLDPSHRAALVKLAELDYRKTNYDRSLKHANAVLKMDTYDSGANYIVGLSYREINDTINALESFGWAARDIKYRSVSYAQMAELYLASQNYPSAKIYARKALDFNTYNLNARKVLAVVARKQKNNREFQQEIEAILKIDALNYFALLEKEFMGGQVQSLRNLIGIENEFSSETILDLALQYHKLGLVEEAIRILDLDVTNPKNKLWLSFILKESDEVKSLTLLTEAQKSSSDFVFPYRRESLPVMIWAAAKQPSSWKFSYYLAQNYLAVGLIYEGKSILKILGNTPDSDVFYRFRAEILKDENILGSLEDYARALELRPADWKVWEENIRFSLETANYEKALALSQKAYKKYPNNYNIGMVHAQSLLYKGENKEVLKVLKNIQVLPFEHANNSRKIYERAHMSIAIAFIKKKSYEKAIQTLNLSKEWPENIGVGKPYEPDERLQNYLLAICNSALVDAVKEQELLKKIIAYSNNNGWKPNTDNLFGLLSLKKLGREEELKTILLKLEEASEDNNLKNQLVLAFFRNDTDELLSLKKKKIITDDLWEIFLVSTKH
ncbi:DUF5107 domain-containing protein [Maribacter sp. ACAM166]|uniref:DUF5107 domain-containing protein n=1 Tax=Maribacter sp. ACAM166 TaxID=2508996 RepID=UPI00148541E5|nr:DUF5107 domain-containing protein [Maribacter sp. ACAM166]